MASSFRLQQEQKQKQLIHKLIGHVLELEVIIQLFFRYFQKQDPAADKNCALGYSEATRTTRLHTGSAKGI